MVAFVAFGAPMRAQSSGAKQVKVPGTARKTNRFSILFMVGM